MNTYDVSVNGKIILQEIKVEDLENKLKEIRGLVWATGGSDRDIEITLNTL